MRFQPPHHMTFPQGHSPALPGKVLIVGLDASLTLSGLEVPSDEEKTRPVLKLSIRLGSALRPTNAGSRLSSDTDKREGAVHG